MKGYIATCQNLGLSRRTFLPVFSFKQKKKSYIMLNSVPVNMQSFNRISFKASLGLAYISSYKLASLGSHIFMSLQRILM